MKPKAGDKFLSVFKFLPCLKLRPSVISYSWTHIAAVSVLKQRCCNSCANPQHQGQQHSWQTQNNIQVNDEEKTFSRSLPQLGHPRSPNKNKVCRRPFPPWGHQECGKGGRHMFPTVLITVSASQMPSWESSVLFPRERDGKSQSQCVWLPQEAGTSAKP